MFKHDRFRANNSSTSIAADEPTTDHRRPVNWWIVAAFLLGVITLSIRFIAIHDDLGDNIADLPLLKAVMRTAADASATTNIPDNIFADGTPSGARARAMSFIASVRGQPTTAEVWLIRGLADRPSSYLSQFELCLLYWNEGQRAKAREACRETGASVQYWLRQGYQYEDLRQPEEALAYYDIATAVDPGSVQGWYVMGRTLFGLDRYEEAIAAYERMMVLNPTPPADVYEALGRSYLKLNNPKLAQDVLDRGLMVFPDHRDYYLTMAEAFRAEGDFRAADSWYARMLQRWPNDVQAWSGRGEVAVADKRLDDAVQYYRRAVENQPQEFGYWLNLASTAWAGGDIPSATEAYQQALALRPDDLPALLQAGRFYVASKQVAEARAVFEHILQLQPDNREASDQLAAIIGSQ